MSRKPRLLLMTVALFGWANLCFSVSELNVDFADEEFARYFSNIQSASLQESELFLDNLNQHLKLKPAQQQTWLRFKVTFLEQIEQRQQKRLKLKEIKSLNSVDTLTLRSSHLETRLKETQTLLAVITPFYQQLDGEQKTQFDKVMQHLWFKRHNHRKNP